MSTHASSPAPDPAGPKRIRPHQLVIVLGIAIGAFTVLSGVVPLITEWHSDSEVTREVFTSIPGPVQVAFYTVIPLLLVWGGWAFAQRVRNWERGGPDRRSTTAKNAKRRF